MKKLFQAEQFTATEFHSAADKAKYANHFVRFVTTGFKPTMFPKWFYTRTSFMWGHIAHYNHGGFYATWFQDKASQLRFLDRSMTAGGYGMPMFTYSDVELALREWIKTSGLCAKLEAEIAAETEGRERSQLARLKAKYEATT